MVYGDNWRMKVILHDALGDFTGEMTEIEGSGSSWDDMRHEVGQAKRCMMERKWMEINIKNITKMLTNIFVKFYKSI